MSGWNAVELVEFGARDGLWIEAKTVSAESGAVPVNALSECGFKRTETGSFVIPLRAPQIGGQQCCAGRFQALSRNLPLGFDSGFVRTAGGD